MSLMESEIGKIIHVTTYSRACATCGAWWLGVEGDSCPKCGGTLQCTCEHCQRESAKKGGTK